MRNYKEFHFLKKNWFDYWCFTLVWPQLFLGRVDDSQDYDAFINNGEKFGIEMRTSCGHYEDNHLSSIWFILLGFGFSIKKQENY